MYGLMQYLYMNLQYWAKYNETNYDLNLTAAFFGDRERYLEQSFWLFSSRWSCYYRWYVVIV